MKSKLIEKWVSQGLKPTDFEFFTNRPNLVLGKLPNQKAEVEYICPYCSFYEIKNIEMEKVKKRFRRPSFECSKCGKRIVVEDLRKI